MLEELLKYDRLGSKDELLFLLFKALPLSKSQKVSDLKKYCTSNHFSIGQSLDGMLKLLEFIEFITISDNIIFINDLLSFFNCMFEPIYFAVRLVNCLQNCSTDFLFKIRRKFFYFIII